jgi:hypothetical protein
MAKSTKTTKSTKAGATASAVADTVADTNAASPAVATEATAPVPAPAPKKEVLKQNGIKRPEQGTITGRLWDIADEISAIEKRPATRKEVVDRYMKEQPNANEATANTQYARWVTYHGATDILREQRKNATAARIEAKEKEKVEAKAKREAERAAKAAEKAKAAEEAKAAREAKAKAVAEEKAEAKRKAEAEAAAKAAAKAAEQEPVQPTA